MDKIKSVLSGHGKSENTTHDSPDSSAGHQHPIYDEMTGQKVPEEGKDVMLGKEGTLAESGGPYAQTHTTSAEPDTTLAKPGLLEKSDRSGSDAPFAPATHTSEAPDQGFETAGDPVASSRPTSTEPFGTSHTATESHLGSSTLPAKEHVDSANPTSLEPLAGSQTTSAGHVSSLDNTKGETVGSSTATAGAPFGTSSTTSGGLHPDTTSTGKESVRTGISDASIKSGVIGFGPSETQSHAAMPTTYTDEQNLHPSQVEGDGNINTAESAAQSDVHPNTESHAIPRSETATHGLQDTIATDTSTHQTPEQPLQQESYTADTDRSFPLAGGVASKNTEDTTIHPHTATSAHEPTTKEESSSTDKERSIPVVGGIISKLTSKDKDTEHAPVHDEKSIPEPAPVTKETESSTTDKERSIPVVGGLVSKLTSKDKEHAPVHDDTTTHEPTPIAKEKESSSAEKERSIPIIGGLLAKLSSKGKDKDVEDPVAHHDKSTSEGVSAIKGTEGDAHGEHKLEAAAPLAAAPLAAGVVSKAEEPTSTPLHTSAAEPAPIGGSATSQHVEPISTHEHTSTVEPVPVVGALASHHDEPAPTSYQTSAVEPLSVTKGTSTTETEHLSPAAGAVLAHHEEPTSTHQPASAVEPDPVAKESSTTQKERSIPLVGGLISRFTSKKEDKETTPAHYDQVTSEREPGTKDREAGVQDGHGREALAGAAAAAAAASAASHAGASKTQPHSEHRDAPLASSQTGTMTTDPMSTAPTSHTTTEPTMGATTTKADSTTHHHNEEALAAATAAATAAAVRSTNEPGQSAQDKGLPGMPSTSTTTHPHDLQSATHHHIPGEFPDPTPNEESRSFLPDHSATEGTVGTAPSAPTSQLPSQTALGATSGSDTTPVQHELRHTGSLDHPASKTSDSPSEHHYGRDAAVAGGLVAGAAGLSHAASDHKNTDDTDKKLLHEETSPYSSKALDPRVMGTKDPLGERGLDTQAPTAIAPHDAAQTSSTAGILPASGLAASDETTKAKDVQGHHGEDAALIGAGASTASALHPSVQRNDTPGTGTFIIPQETSETSVPLSSSTAPHESLSTAAPLASEHSTIQPSSNLGHTSDPITTESTTSAPYVTEKDSEHHLGRDAALAGAGAATAGGLLAATHDHKTDTQPASSQLEHTSYPTATESTKAAPQVPERDPEHHLGRDAALAGAGAATVGGLHERSHESKMETGPASKTIGPHDSNLANILDPRVQPDPSKQKDYTTTGPHGSDLLNKLDPRVDEKTVPKDEHHHGRDAAIIGATGAAAGYGVHEATKAHDEHRSEQLETPATRHLHDATATGVNTSDPVPTKDHIGSTGPSTIHDTDHHTALGTGAGLGAGVAAYEGTKHAGNTRDLPLHQKEDIATSGQPGPMTQPGYTQDTSMPPSARDTAGHQRYDSIIDPSKQHHDKRDAALAGAAGAAVVGGVAHEHAQHQDAEADRERARLEKEQEKIAKKEAHDHEKEAHKLQKEQHKHDKEIAAAEHKQEKEAHKLQKEQHKHEKEAAALEKAEHKREKEEAKETRRVEKEEHKREKEEEKEARRLSKSEEGEKKGGLFGFLHRDKSKKEKTSPESSPRRSAEYAAAGTAGAVAAGTAAAAHHHHHEEDDPNSPRWKGKTLLHKDPPVGHPAREAMEHQSADHPEQLTGKREHIGVDGPIGHPNLTSGDRETKKGAFGAHEVIAPGESQTVIEPHTGLAMNIGKFGLGTGGTDGNPAIAGHHSVEGAGQATGPLANPEFLEGHHPMIGTESGMGKDVNPVVGEHHHMASTTTGNTTGIGSAEHYPMTGTESGMGKDVNPVAEEHHHMPSSTTGTTTGVTPEVGPTATSHTATDREVI